MSESLVVLSEQLEQRITNLTRGLAIVKKIIALEHDDEISQDERGRLMSDYAHAFGVCVGATAEQMEAFMKK